MIDPPRASGEQRAEFERHIALEDALNFRDVGGYRAVDGRTVRWRRMFRSGGLSQLSPADLVVLRELGISTVLDLRTTREWESGRFPAHEIPVTFHHLPIVEDILDPNRYDVTEGMMAVRYQEYAQVGATNIARAISIVAEADAHPIVVHCLAGKDRTGIVVALILALLGIPDDTITQDYALSNQAMVKLRERAMADPLLRQRAAEVTDEMLQAKPSNVEALFEELRSAHGSIEDYVISAGLRPAAIESLRGALLE